MSSEPGFFYTVELPEKYGLMLERLAAESGGSIDTESMAASLLCEALRMEPVLKEDDNLRIRLWETVIRAEKGENIATREPASAAPPISEDNGLPWPGHREGPDDLDEPF